MAIFCQGVVKPPPPIGRPSRPSSSTAEPEQRSATSIIGLAREHSSPLRLGNDFLPNCGSTSGCSNLRYYGEPAFTLEQGPLAKLDTYAENCIETRRKGSSRTGAGGGLVAHGERWYCVDRAEFNISREQVAFAREARGLDRMPAGLNISRRLSERDRHLRTGVRFGRMLRNTSIRELRRDGHVVIRTLTSAGRGMINRSSAIVRSGSIPWTDKRFFPGAYHPPGGGRRCVMKCSNLRAQQVFSLDVENLACTRPHARSNWLERFERLCRKVARSASKTASGRIVARFCRRRSATFSKVGGT